MTKQPCRNHNPASKAKVAIAAIRGESSKTEAAPVIDAKVLLAKIGELTLANNY